jgi:hypothetical protein
MSEREPSTAEVQQAEPEAFAEDYQVVTVKVAGPVRAQQLPSTSYADHTADLDAVTAVKIASRDPRRAYMHFIASATCWVGPVQSAAKQNVGGKIPSGIVVPNYHTEEVWGIAEAGTATITVHEEYWTD